MNVNTAAFNLVHDYPGGAEALAPQLKKSPTTLNHEVDPNYASAKFGLVDAVKATILTGDRQVLNAFAADCNCMVVPLPQCADGIDDDTFKGVTALAREFAELVGQVSDATADDVVSDNELKRVEREAAELMAAVQLVLVSLRKRNEASKPSTLRVA